MPNEPVPGPPPWGTGPPESPWARPPKRILIIEDEPTVRALLSKWMQRAGYGVATATNGLEGLELARRERFDLVITDLVMPEREGIETISELRRDRLADRVLAVSGAGAGAGDYLRAAELLGADRTLRKPFGAKELLEVVAELLALQPSGSNPRIVPVPG